MKYCNFRPVYGCLFFQAVLPDSASEANETPSSGAFNINMGIAPQPVGKGPKPYGLICDLVKNHAAPGHQPLIARFF